MKLLFKRCMLILIFILLMPICLSNCGCQHNWDSATCDQLPENIAGALQHARLQKLAIFARKPKVA